MQKGVLRTPSAGKLEPRSIAMSTEVRSCPSSPKRRERVGIAKLEDAGDPSEESGQELLSSGKERLVFPNTRYPPSQPLEH